MRLYTTSGATRVDDPQYGTFLAGPRGEFEFPDALSVKLHAMHIDKKRQWETDDERVKRVSEEELASVRDPATLLAAVKDMGTNQSLLTQALAKMLGLDTPAPAAPAEQASTSQAESGAEGEVVQDEAPAEEAEPQAPAKGGRRAKTATPAA